MSDDRLLLWLDLETTGSEDTDEIIEIGCLLTDSNLDIINKFESRSWIVKCSADAAWQMLKNKVVREMHAANGLLWPVIDGEGESVSDVEAVILNSLIELEPHSRRVMLAGSGVGHFDRKMIRRQMPRLDKYLHYAPFDIGNIRRAFKAWGLPIPSTGQKGIKTHRALEDATLHLEEARVYKTLFQSIVI